MTHFYGITLLADLTITPDRKPNHNNGKLRKSFQSLIVKPTHNKPSILATNDRSKKLGFSVNPLVCESWVFMRFVELVGGGGFGLKPAFLRSNFQSWLMGLLKVFSVVPVGFARGILFPHYCSF
jgi:hypothetical protein